MEAYGLSDLGLIRRENQDAYYMSEHPVGSSKNLFLVLDGVGGSEGGRDASRYAMEEFVRSMEKAEDPDTENRLRKSVDAANEYVRKKSEESGKYNACTTLVACTVEGGFLHVVNVGDSRLYHFRDELTQITEDHSYRNEMIRRGLLRKEDPVSPEFRHVVTRVIGEWTKVQADYFLITLKEGDIVLLCSDGLSNMLSSEEMSEVLRRKTSLREMGDELLKRAKDAGGFDNITLVLLRLEKEDVE